MVSSRCEQEVHRAMERQNIAPKLTAVTAPLLDADPVQPKRRWAALNVAGLWGRLSAAATTGEPGLKSALLLLRLFRRGREAHEHLLERALGDGVVLEGAWWQRRVCGSGAADRDSVCRGGRACPAR